MYVEYLLMVLYKLVSILMLLLMLILFVAQNDIFVLIAGKRDL